MTKRELIDFLTPYGDDMDVMILDGFNGGGVAREINLGPCEHVITAAEANEASDCDGRVGNTVVVIGYGCY